MLGSGATLLTGRSVRADTNVLTCKWQQSEA